MRHPLYILYALAIIGSAGFAQYRGLTLTSPEIIRDVPRSMRNNPGAYRSHYGGFNRYIGGK
jgi:hypothetical protein